MCPVQTEWLPSHAEDLRPWASERDRPRRLLRWEFSTAEKVYEQVSEWAQCRVACSANNGQRREKRMYVRFACRECTKSSVCRWHGVALYDASAKRLVLRATEVWTWRISCWCAIIGHVCIPSAPLCIQYLGRPLCKNVDNGRTQPTIQHLHALREMFVSDRAGAVREVCGLGNPQSKSQALDRLCLVMQGPKRTVRAGSVDSRPRLGMATLCGMGARSCPIKDLCTHPHELPFDRAGDLSSLLF